MYSYSQDNNGVSQSLSQGLNDKMVRGDVMLCVQYSK